MADGVNLQNLPAPKVIEEIDYEAILGELIDDFIARSEGYTALVESDPVYKELEVAAYREMLLRQRINNAAKAVMLPYATGTDLDNLAAFYFVERLIVDPGDQNATPPIDPTYEDDARLLERVLLSPGQFSTAGAESAYRYHAMTSSASVKNVGIKSPTPGNIQVTVLSTAGNGVPDATLLSAVNDALSADFVRPLTDTVNVQAAEVLEYTIDATLYLYPRQVSNIIEQTALERVVALVDELHRIGYDVHNTAITSALKVAGVQRVELSGWVDIAVADYQAAYCTGINLTIGGTDV
ncbi:baseplate J/gp47 family protein [Hydrogenovibrio sp. 3SP14C1]|uniref:baseplate assembly protein n=1 Tax=Hydrogenovibrio sp. 3SP14C1 TaxID=3038774 RepID=UPI0024162498|nr:baseplate J/gp47 family protein [Hydrogenovibrio sp. 3SP14C1]MDG4811646.1 baseplate J/gp47 family protein [Hydrogenovibrio sp. 3SP14C1]